MARQKTAFITGIAGQDGAYLADFLLNKGYVVHGLVRWDSYSDPVMGVGRLDELGLLDRVTLHYGDITDAQAVVGLVKNILPDEIYNLAALSHVGVSFDTPAATFDINTKGTLAILESVRILDLIETVRIYQASSSEMFGSSPGPQNEDTPMKPCSPYGVAKLAAFGLAQTYRDSYGMFVANGILFNHESVYRGEDFVTRKISKAVAEIEMGRTEPLRLGNLDSIRDWGCARDYVDGMWRMLQMPESDDYVLATGEAKTVRNFVTRAFAHIGVRLLWEGHGVSEIAKDRISGRVLVEVDEALFRPKDVNYLLGDASKAQRELGWKPQCYFETLVSEMVNADRDFLRKQGHKPYTRISQTA